MDSFKLWPALVALVIGGAIGYFIGKNSAPTSTSTKTKTEQTVPAEKKEKENLAVPVANTSSDDNGNESEASEENTEATASQEKEREKNTVPEKLPTLPIKNLCYTGDVQLSEDLTLFAERMEKDKLMYDNKNPERLQDCSGIFHRVVQHVKGSCNSYKYPEPKDARDSRSLAKWFDSNNNFTIINDAVDQRNLIRPGAVMFFGRSDQKYNNLNMDNLTTDVIAHIGVVTEVTKDENGDITGYVMMHGRRPGVHAQRSHYHQIAPPRAGFPPLGNWSQQWVGIAYIMTPS